MAAASHRTAHVCRNLRPRQTEIGKRGIAEHLQLVAEGCGGAKRFQPINQTGEKTGVHDAGHGGGGEGVPERTAVDLPQVHTSTGGEHDAAAALEVAGSGPSGASTSTTAARSSRPSTVPSSSTTATGLWP